MVSKNVKIVQAVGMVVTLVGLALIGGAYWIDANASNAHNAAPLFMPLGKLSTIVGIITASIGASIAWWQST